MTSASIRITTCVLLAFMLGAGVSYASEEPTNVTVRVIAKGGKFVATTMGGVRVVLRDSATGEVLASGITSGTSGDTERIMLTPLKRGEPLSTPAQIQRDAGLATGRFVARLDIDAPVKVRVEATGPLAQLQAAVTVTSEQWVIPGKHITAGDGWVLELPGLAVDILSPVAHSSVPGEIAIEANVMLMCGCPITAGGTWDAKDYQVTAIIIFNGKQVDEIPLAYAGTANQFAAAYSPQRKGPMTITVTAWSEKDGNTGLDRTTVFAN